eukprot:m.71651 g.71651  ORF g.71651 m.71651 type:complete len:471 (+) comp18653_c0_seq1:297-1709(+)
MSGRTLLLVVAVVGSAVFPGGNAGSDAEHVDVVPRTSDTVDASELDGAAAVNIGGTVGGTRVRDDPLPTGKNFIAFGSCNKQYLPQPAWDAILRKAPDLFLFTGDAVYTNANHLDQVEAIHEALAMQSARTEYKDFVARIPVDGVWDDHDYGRNDAGKEFEDRAESQEAFLSFLQVPRDDARWTQDGVYWSRRLYGGRVQIIALDTRSHRDSYFIPSVGGNPRVPLRGLVAGLIRFATARLGFGTHHAGDVLGEAQWLWLERVLAGPADADSTQAPDLTVVISSVQVTTSNPLVESWGHFPRARQRLVRLLQEHRPRGLLLLSGDVHIGEMAASAPGNAGTLEVTSSGLTHSCSGSIVGATCGPILDTYRKHRQQDGGRSDYFLGQNFGGLEMDWSARQYNVSVFDLEGAPVLTATRSFDDRTTIADPALPTIFDQQDPLIACAAIAAALIVAWCLVQCRHKKAPVQKRD